MRKKGENSEDQTLARSLYSPEAENAVIGCMLAQPEEVIEEIIQAELFREDFFIPANQVIFALLRRMHEDGEAIDMMTVHQAIVDAREQENLQSPGCLATYAVAFATHLNVGSYIKIVKDKAVLRAIEVVSSEMKRDVREMPDNVGEVLERAESAITAIVDGVAIQAEANFGMEIEEAALSIFEHAETGGGLRGLPTGFKKMDQLTMGWIRGELIIVAARPGRGKTGLALAFMKTLVEDQFNAETGNRDAPGKPIQMFSMEMRRHELYMRLYAMTSGVGLTDILTGKIDEKKKVLIEWAQNEMRRWPIFIDDTPRMDIALIRARSRRAVRKHKACAIFVDYLQLAKSRKYPKDRQNEVADISGQLKQIAMENEVPVICLAQLNRTDAEKEDVEPHISNIRDSGAIEQDADKIILLHQDNNADRKSKQSEAIKHYVGILAKHRNGKQGRVEMDFHAWKVYFQEADVWNRT